MSTYANNKDDERGGGEALVDDHFNICARASSGSSGALFELDWFADCVMKQIYKITFPTGKIYIGKDSVGSHRYFGSPDMDIINADFEKLPKEIRMITPSESKSFGNLKMLQRQNYQKKRLSLFVSINRIILKQVITGGQSSREFT